MNSSLYCQQFLGQLRKCKEERQKTHACFGSGFSKKVMNGGEKEKRLRKNNSWINNGILLLLQVTEKSTINKIDIFIFRKINDALYEVNQKCKQASKLELKEHQPFNFMATLSHFVSHRPLFQSLTTISKKSEHIATFDRTRQSQEQTFTAWCS